MTHSEDSIVFHLPGDWLDAGGTGLPRFYRRIAEGLAARGHPHRFVAMDRNALAAQIEADRAFHILNHARHPHPRVLTAGIAYVYPYWHLDPLGIRAFASIRDRAFDPDTVDGDTARRFLRKLRTRLVAPRRSRYPQPEAREAVPQGCIAVFLQSEGHRNLGETLWLDRWEMLRTCLAAAQGRPVVVKPHPRDLDPATGQMLERLMADHPALHVSTANIHDILPVAERVVTINSAVGIEALMHRKPVILCGQADFRHIADEARDAQALAGLLAIPPARRPYARYLHWYFAEQCLSAGEADLAGQVLARMAAHLRAGG